MTSNFLLLTFYFFIFLFGLIIGSFLNCLIWRVYKKIPLTPFIKGASDRSYCPKCKKQIAWYDNIPILSFILLKGKCRHCGKPISWQYPMVELATGVLFVLAFYNNFQIPLTPFIKGAEIPLTPFVKGGVLQFSILTSNFLLLTSIFRDWFIISVMIVVFVIDLRWYLILDAVTMPAAGIIFVLNLILGLNPPNPLYQGGIIGLSWQNLLFSGIIGGSFFLIQFVISKGKWIGGGDIRLGLLMGLALGWPNVLTAIFLAYFIGSIFGIGLILTGRKKWKSQVPLGTFLAVAAIITLLWGDKILGWYLGILAN